MSMPIPDGSVIITPMQQYEQQQRMNDTLKDVSNTLIALTGKFDHYQDDQAKRMEAIDGKDGELVQLKRRVSNLERWRWVTTGVIGALSSGATAAVYEAVAARR